MDGRRERLLESGCARWMDSVAPGRPSADRTMPILGILTGEGVGPEVVGATLGVLDALESVTPLRTLRRCGGEIGLRADGEGALTDDVAAFCQQIFDDGGALLCGPGGGRFVYDLRRRFDLFCKL